MSEFVAHCVRQVFRENAQSATTGSSYDCGLNFNAHTLVYAFQNCPQSRWAQGKP